MKIISNYLEEEMGKTKENGSDRGMQLDGRHLHALWRRRDVNSSSSEADRIGWTDS